MNQDASIGWGSTRITYEVMTDSKGEKWDVPTTINGEPVEYLRRHDETRDATWDRITHIGDAT